MEATVNSASTGAGSHGITNGAGGGDSPGFYVAYPTHWLRTLTPADYVTVTLLNGSQVRYCRDAMEREVMDTASEGCHVRMTTSGASQGVMLGEQGSTTVVALSAKSDDEMPPLVVSDSEC